MFVKRKDKSKITSYSEEVITLYKSLTRTVILMMVTAFTLVFVAVAWFVANSSTNSGLSQVSASSKNDFALATVGTRDQGIYDKLLSLFSNSDTETINGITYYIATGNSSLRLDSDKNLNNFYTNQDLRPGNKGSFDIYVICRSNEREFVLKPCLKAYLDETENNLVPLEDVKTDFLYGHILFFTGIDNKGMYSGDIDMSKNIKVDLSNCEATQSSLVAEGGIRTFSWGEQVASENGITVFKLPVYWVWPEQFGNYIYTGNAYNKNLFSTTESVDYKYFVNMMESTSTNSRYFDGVSEQPQIAKITNNANYQEATKYYNLYSSWYDKADEWIGENVNYIELGFELADKTVEGE